MKKIEITIGERRGRLVLIKESDRLRLPSGQVNRAVLCKCDCGNETVVRIGHWVRNKIRSCSCNLGEKRGEFREEKLHNSWRSMRNRCSPTYMDKHLYSDKGITVCPEWKSFKAFEKWAMGNGWKKGLTIDRIDGNKGYEPDNCRWADAITQANNINTNIIISYNGQDRPFSLVIHEKGLDGHYATIIGRIKRGWEPQTAIDTPIRKGNYSQRWLKKAS